LDRQYERVCLLRVVITGAHVRTHAPQREVAIAVVIHVPKDCSIDAVRVTCGRRVEIVARHGRVGLELVVSIEAGVWDLHAAVAPDGELAGQRVAVHDDAEGGNEGREIPALRMCQSQVTL